jgi:hypothetical protein
MNKQMEVQGKIKLIEETKTFGAKEFKKRGVVVTTDEQYPQDIMIEFVQDKCSVLDKYKVNDRVKIGINLRGREWVNPQGESKYFNTIQGWRIDKAEGGASIPPPDQAFEPAGNLNEAEDDLPF